MRSLGFNRSFLTLLLAQVNVFCWKPLASGVQIEKTIKVIRNKKWKIFYCLIGKHSNKLSPNSDTCKDDHLVLTTIHKKEENRMHTASAFTTGNYDCKPLMTDVIVKNENEIK